MNTESIQLGKDRSPKENNYHLVNVFYNLSADEHFTPKMAQMFQNQSKITLVNTKSALKLHPLLPTKLVIELKESIKALKVKLNDEMLKSTSLTRELQNVKSTLLTLKKHALWDINISPKFSEYESQMFSYLNHVWKICFKMNEFCGYSISLCLLPPFKLSSLVPSSTKYNDESHAYVILAVTFSLLPPNPTTLPFVRSRTNRYGCLHAPNDKGFECFISRERLKFFTVNETASNDSTLQSTFVSGRISVDVIIELVHASASHSEEAKAWKL